jgi:hypothetical protein
MSEEQTDAEIETKTSETESTENTSESETSTEKENLVSKKAEDAAKAAEDAAKAAQEALAKAAALKAEAEAAAEEEYKAIAAEVKAQAAKAPAYTFKRAGEEIFRREMGEPEFWLDKNDRFLRPVLTSEQQESLTLKAETPADQTPRYIPQHVLSPEFEGLSNYERGVGAFLDETKTQLEKLKGTSDSTEKQIKDAEDKITYLESLHENYYIGMNIFRTAKGGRDKIKS